MRLHIGVRGTCEGGAGETERTLVGVEAPAGGRGEGGVAVGVFLGVRARAPRGRGMMEQGHKSLSGECGVLGGAMWARAGGGLGCGMEPGRHSEEM